MHNDLGKPPYVNEGLIPEATQPQPTPETRKEANSAAQVDMSSTLLDTAGSAIGLAIEVLVNLADGSN